MTLFNANLEVLNNAIFIAGLYVGISWAIVYLDAADLGCMSSRNRWRQWWLRRRGFHGD